MSAALSTDRPAAPARPPGRGESPGHAAPSGRASERSRPASADDEPEDATDVLVVGGGVIGLTAAWRASRAGLRVTVLDPSPGDGATHAAAGMLAPVTEADFGEEAALRLGADSAARWPAFAAELEADSGLDVGLRATGTLTLAYDGDDLTLGRRVRALQEEWGLDSTEISVAAAREREPLVGQRVAGAFWAPGDHQVDPRAVHRALTSALARDPRAAVVRRRAGRLLRAAGPSAPGPGSPVTGALDDAGVEHRAGTVVLAAGADSGSLLAGVPEVRAPTRPVKGQTLRLDAPPWFTLDHVVRGIVQGRPVYVVPRTPGPDGHREVVVGATSEEHPDDRRATAGGVFALLRDARALLPGLDELALVEVTPRVRPGTPDNLPFLGPTTVPGLVLATGHYRNGVLLAPVTGAAVDALLAGAPLPPTVAAIDPMRFSPAPAPAPSSSSR
ncbi:glycine oxidase ThiO [Oerskovia jenensis]|uniref:glycine oxidase n=1 Tax=Oerskovia jenensis TaxID=162169 RepID=A0ABS2LCU1_9CELL|nr:glycine oxidase ThiO [Oerskovia jenensis]MBM7478238.1 glycine oxidase [Oerskovia jenensis]